eukprot:261756-Rhodomonas_salina.3
MHRQTDRQTDRQIDADPRPWTLAPIPWTLDPRPRLDPRPLPPDPRLKRNYTHLHPHAQTDRQTDRQILDPGT